MKPQTGVAYVNDQSVAEIAPNSVQAVGDLTVIVRATDNAAPISQVRILVDGEGRARSDAVPFSWKWRTGEESTGNHLLEVRMTDQKGNENSASVTVATLAQ